MCRSIAEGGGRRPGKLTTQAERDEKLTQLRTEEVQAHADASNRHLEFHGLPHADPGFRRPRRGRWPVPAPAASRRSRGRSLR
jgi:hypothetical protein